MKNRYVIITVLVSMSLLLLIPILMLTGNIVSFDKFVYHIITINKNNVLTSIFKFITFLGGAFTLITISLLSFLVIKNKKYGILISGNLIVIYLINYLMKIIIRRPRPSGINLVDASGFSFPSGHSMISFAFYGFIIYMVYHNIKSNKLKWFIIAIMSILIFLIGISRIYLGVHYASDVLAGFLLSLIYLVVFINTFRKVLLFIYNKE